MNNPRKKAFTLVELLVVIAILAILATTSVVGYTAFITKANISADEQEIAQLNGYLTLIGKVENATQLEQIVDQAFGEGKFSTLEPRSAQHGYHYWYDVQNNQVLLKTYQEIQSLNSTRMRKNAMGGGTSSSSVALLASQNAFANGDLRMFGNYYVMDANGIVVGAINSLNAFDSVQSVQQAVATLSNVKSTHKDSDFAQAVLQKVAKVAFVASDVTFVFNADQVETFRFADGVSTISSNVVHNGVSKNYVALASKVNSLSIPGSVQTVQENALVFDQAGVVRIHTQLANIQEISGVFHANSTNGIIVDSTNVEYTIDGGAISSGNQSANLGYTNPVESFDIVTPADTDDYKTVVGTLYVAYNYTGAIQLSASNFANASGSDLVSSTEVKWSCQHPNVQIGADGKLSIVGVPTLENCTATITATAVAGGKTQTLTVYVVRPNNATFQVGNVSLDMAIDPDIPVETVNYSYNGTNAEIIFDPSVTLNTSGIVSCQADVVVTAGEGNLFTITNNVLVLNTNLQQVAGQQQFTVTVGTALSKTFNLVVTDNSSKPFEVNSPFNAPSFLYRVGNQNGVDLRLLFNSTKAPASTALSIFDVSNQGPIGSDQQFTAKLFVNGTAKEAWEITYSEWSDPNTSIEIQFDGTGVATITLGDASFTMEVVEGLNVTDYSQLNGNKNNVLLNDIAMVKNDDRFALIGGTLYGNDFTFDVTKGNYNADPDNNGKGQISENYVILLQNGILDNVQIIGKPFDDFSATTGNDDNICNVLSIGNDRIINCYITNCAAPVRAKDSNLEIINTTLRGGSIANLDIRGGNIVLDNVTTINQKSVNGVKDSDGAVGLGIVVWYESSSATITIKNKLTQYNYLSSTDFSELPLKFSENGPNYAPFVSNEIFASNSSGTSKFIYSANGEKWVNTGIFSLTDKFTGENIMPSQDMISDGYQGAEVNSTGVTGYLMSIKKEQVELSNYPANSYQSAGQGIILPEFNWDIVTNGEDNNRRDDDADKDYCIVESGQIKISYSDSSSNVLKLNGMASASKGGKQLTLTNVKLNGVVLNENTNLQIDGVAYDYSTNTLTFNGTGTNNYQLTFVFDDKYNYSNNGTSVTAQYEYNVSISATMADPDAKHAEFAFADTNTATEKITINNKTYISATGVSATDKEWGYITVGGTKVFYPITEAKMQKNLLGTEVQVFYYVFKDTITITDYSNGGIGKAFAYDASTTKMPSNLTVVKGMEAKYDSISSACVDISKLTKDGPSGEVWDFSASTTVSGTTQNNGYLAHQSPSGLSIKSGTRDYDAITVAQFSYTDEAGSTYYYFVGYFMPNQVGSSSSGGGGGCVTPDTLITLADGSQKRVDQLTGEETLLVWNLETGCYDVAPIVFVDSEQQSDYNVVHLYFSDGTEVKVISEHGFFDVDLAKYVYIDEYNYQNYIGHKFVATGNIGANTWQEVTLERVVVQAETTTAWSPVTAEHLCYYTNGILSMPGGIEGLFNIFDVDTGIMRYDQEKMAQDIEKYGLYTYEDFAGIIPVEAYVAFNGDWLKVAMGKGFVTWDDIQKYADRYIPLM